MNTHPPTGESDSSTGHLLSECEQLVTAGAVGQQVPSVPGYTIEKELGRGGVGVVYLARHHKLDRVCALKMLLSGGHSGTLEVARFRSEARAIARLQHPGIVQVFEIGEHDGKPFIALEYCAGGSLDKRLRDKPPKPFEAAMMVRDLAVAMQEAHDAQVIHRDLKPANVLIAADGTLKVTDFGLAKKLDEEGRTLTGAVLGTPNYMAPEQARGDKNVGPVADIYALGAILYECLAGRPPFRAASPRDTIQQVLNDDPVPVRQQNRHVPRDLETICLKCLEKQPSQRYRSAAALGEDLCRFLDGKPVKARRASCLGTSWKWVERNPTGTLLIVSLFLLAAVVGWSYGWRASVDALNREGLADALDRTENALRTGTIDAAEAAFAEAARRSKAGSNKDFEARVTRCQRELGVLHKLNQTTNLRWGMVGDNQEAIAGWRAAFSGFGIKPGETDPKTAAHLVSESAISEKALAAFDLWFADSPSKDLLDILRQADPDPYRNAVRDAILKREEVEVQKLAEQDNLFKQPPRFITALSTLSYVPSVRWRIALENAAVEHQNVGIFTALAHTYSNKEPSDVAERVRWFQASVVASPKNAAAWSNLGVALHQKADLNGAIGALEQSIKLDNEYAPAYYNLANVRKKQGKLDEAITKYRRAIKLSPQFPIFYHNYGSALGDMGTALLKNGDLDKAIDVFRQATEALREGIKRGKDERSHAYDRIHYSLRIALVVLGAALTNKGVILTDNKELDNAIDYFQQAIKVIREGIEDNAVLKNDPKIKNNPQYIRALATAHVNLGTVLFDQNKFPMAIAQAHEAIKADLSYAHAHALLGDSLLRTGDTPSAREAFTEAAKLDPKKFGPLLNKLPRRTPRRKKPPVEAKTGSSNRRTASARPGRVRRPGRAGPGSAGTRPHRRRTAR